MMREVPAINSSRKEAGLSLIVRKAKSSARSFFGFATEMDAVAQHSSGDGGAKSMFPAKIDRPHPRWRGSGKQSDGPCGSSTSEVALLVAARVTFVRSIICTRPSVVGAHQGSSFHLEQLLQIHLTSGDAICLAHTVRELIAQDCLVKRHVLGANTMRLLVRS